MQEEFYGIRNADNITIAWQQKYGWNSLNANVWLPSLSELVGIDLNHYNTTWGTYYSAMQGLNSSEWYYVDAQGGTQFAYFKQYNQSGGGEQIWSMCKQQPSWLRSSKCTEAVTAWMMLNATYFHSPLATESNAVHPAAG